MPASSVFTRTSMLVCVWLFLGSLAGLPAPQLLDRSVPETTVRLGSTVNERSAVLWQGSPPEYLPCDARTASSSDLQAEWQSCSGTMPAHLSPDSLCEHFSGIRGRCSVRRHVAAGWNALIRRAPCRHGAHAVPNLAQALAGVHQRMACGHDCYYQHSHTYRINDALDADERAHQPLQVT